MEAAAMIRLLASADGGDALALRRDLRLALDPALDEHELQERAREAVTSLRSPSARLVAVARAVLSTSGLEHEEEERLTAGEWLIVDALAVHASDTLVAGLNGATDGEKQPEEEEEDALWEVLAVIVTGSTDELGRGGRDKRWIQLIERSLRAVLAVQEENGEVGEKEKKTVKRPSKTKTTAVRAVARALLTLHKTLAERRDGHGVGLKLATLVWKNLTKLARSHTNLLFQEDGEGDPRDNTAPLDAEDVVNSVVAAMEATVGELLAVIQLKDGVAMATRAATTLKMLRLYWRAFQGHFLPLAAALSSSTLENCVLAVVNTASALVHATIVNPSAGSRHQLPLKLAIDFRSVLELVMAFPSKIASTIESTPPSLPETGVAIMQALLWYPAQDMVRAIFERQDPEDPEHSTPTNDSSTMEISIRWTHWCLLVSMTATSRSEDLAGPQTPLESDTSIAEVLDKLFDRCRDDCAVKSSASTLTSVSPLVVDSLLELATRFSGLEQLQLSLLKHAVHPSLNQRYVCWMLWRELLCYCWEEDTALAALETLLTLMEQESEDGESSQATKPPPLPAHVVGDITRLVAFVYPDLPLVLKETCMNRVTSVIQSICSDGPYHSWSPAIASRLSLFEQLASIQFLRDYEHPDKEQWIATQLPLCFECCGTIIELLGPTTADPGLRSDADKFAGALRVLEVCLMVLKSVYDDNDAREDLADLHELSRILLPVMTEVLSLLATTLPQVQSTGLSSTRVLDACLYLLSKMSALLKRNQSNQCVQVMKNLLEIVSHNTGVSMEMAGAVAWFVKTVLFDVQAAESDVPVVTELFTALFQRLCAVEKADMTSPLGQVVLEGVYKVLAHSNVAQSLSIQAAMPAVGARQALRQLVLLHREYEGDTDALERAAIAFVSTSDGREQHARRCRRVFSQWFIPNASELAGERAKERKRRADERGEGERSHTETKGGDTKRRKLEHLVARCRQVIDNCGATAEQVSDQELDRAVKVLEDIIAKVLTG